MSASESTYRGPALSAERQVQGSQTSSCLAETSALSGRGYIAPNSSGAFPAHLPWLQDASEHFPFLREGGDHFYSYTLAIRISPCHPRLQCLEGLTPSLRTR